MCLTGSSRAVAGGLIRRPQRQRLQAAVRAVRVRQVEAEAGPAEVGAGPRRVLDMRRVLPLRGRPRLRTSLALILTLPRPPLHRLLIQTQVKGCPNRIS